MDVMAFYLPKAPAVSCLGQPREFLVNDLITLSAFLVLVSIILGGEYYRATRAAKTSVQKSPPCVDVGGRG